jgi:Ca-activated chloride channel family protein
MSFLWPRMLWLLASIPALMATYFILRYRRRKPALPYPGVAVARQAMEQARPMKQYIPALLLLLALCLTIIAIARPTTIMTLPSRYKTVVLAIDTSLSMLANDVAPSRIAAAQAAARLFVERHPAETRIGIVSFAAAAFVAQPPVNNRQDVFTAIDQLELDGGTAIGSAILVSLKVIFPDIELDADSQDLRPPGRRGNTPDKMPRAPPVPPGSYSSAAIILLTDGQSTTGPDPIVAARLAAERGVRVFTVAVGTTEGDILGAEGWAMHVVLDEESLKNIASITAAEYFHAGSAIDLDRIYRALNSRLVLEKKETEITALFTAAGFCFMLLSGLLSVAWFRPPA